MNANALVKNYGRLAPEERFRLILAARGRGDEAESDRLANSGGRLTLSMYDHVPYVHAFDELAMLVFIELLEETGRYDDACEGAEEEACYSFDDDDEEVVSDEAETEAGGEAEEEPGARTHAEQAEGWAGERPLWQRTRDLAFAAGFMLRTKTEGWKLFCERMHIPPFLLWEMLPGFDRLQRALALAEKATFFPEDMVRLLNTIRHKHKHEATVATVENLMSAEKVADELAKMFRQRADAYGVTAR
jgi:hypothetical protein